MNKTFISAFVTGLIFGIGLLVSGMANPDKVLSFLDLAGAWDPSLALVMAGAIAARVALGAGELKAAVFVGAMLAGMGLFELLEHRKPTTGQPAKSH